MSIDPDLIEIANNIITEYINTDIDTIKKSDFLWSEQEKYTEYDEKKMVAALRNFVIEMKTRPTSADELIPYFLNLPTGGSSNRRKRRFRKSKRRKSKRRGKTLRRRK